MKNNAYLLAVMCAAIGATVVVLVLQLLSLISWSLVWAGLIVLLLPYCHEISVKFKNSKYYDFAEFIDAEMKEANKSKKSEIEW